MAIGTTLKIAFDGSQVDRGVRGISSSMKGLASVGSAVAATFSAIVSTTVVAGMVSFAKSASSAAAEMETMQTAFTVLVGDAQKASDILEDIREYGARTPFGQADLKQATQTLLGFGVASEDAMGIIRELGDVSMGNAQKLQSLALVFGQITSSGRLTGGDLLRLINVGFNPLNIISEKTGVSISDLRKEMSKGNITAGMFRETLRIATSEGGLYNGMIEKMADTTEGKFSNMRDAINELKISFGKGFNVAVNKALDHVNEFLPKFEKSFAIVGDRVGFALAEAMEGNYNVMVEMGVILGGLIAEGMKIGLKTGLRGFGTFIINNLGAAITGAEDYHTILDKSVGELNKRDLEDLIDETRIAINQLLYGDLIDHPRYGTMRPTRTGEEGDFEIDGRWYTLFQQIERNTRQDEPSTM